MPTDRIAPTSIGFAALALTAGLLHVAEVRNRPTLPEFAARTELPVEYSRMLALSADSLASDVLWIEFVQEIPNSPADDALGASLSRKARAVTALDPWFHSGYLHGSTLLAVLGSRPCDALRLADEGARRFPTDWMLPFQAGYTCMIELGDSSCALPRMQRATETPGAPPWLNSLVARLMVESNRHQGAVELLKQQIVRVSDPVLKERLKENLKEAIVSRDLGNLSDAVRRWQIAHDGALPASLETLAAGGMITAVPADPFGGVYHIALDGHVRTTSGHEGLRTYRSSGALTGAFAERLFTERVTARVFALRGPLHLHALTDPLALRGGDLDPALDSLELALELTTVAHDREEIRVMEGRILLRHDEDLLRRAQIELLRAHPAGPPPSIEAIASAAGVPPTDVFGSAWVLDRESRLPRPGGGRQPALAVRSDSAVGEAACR